MRVISQNGLIDVPYEMTALRFYDGLIKMNMIGDTGKGSIIAQYSTQEKAEKAMQKLHEFYMGVFVLNDAPNTEESIDKLQNLNQSFFSLQPYKKESSIEIVGNSVFRFPEEEEL